HTLRALLGRGRGLPQSAFRNLLSPGRGLLHPPWPATLRAGYTGRAQGAARFRAHRNVVGALHRRSALRSRGRRLSARGTHGGGLVHARGAGSSSVSTQRRAGPEAQMTAVGDSMRGSIVWLSERDSPDAFPPVDRALREPDGLLAAGGDLSAQRLLAAYRRGIFPWYSRGQPILWWSPDPRAVLFPARLKVSRSLGKSIRNRGFETRIDTAFREVIRACGSAALRPGGTWLSPEMRAAYLRLHRL